MKMVKSVYKKILENVPTHMPETGGMLGGQDGTVTKVVFDGGKDDDFRRCHYTPNVTMLNSCLVEWSESGIEFYGLFHTHFYGVSSLSKGDEIYIDDMCAAIETVPVIYMSKLEMMYEDFPFKKQWGHSCHKRYWEEYSMVVIDSMQFKVIPTPGHLPGSVCIITNKYLISGDLLTNDSIGRTDFIGGNVNDMFFSLEKVLKLSDSLIVLPGHGAVTTMEKIKNCNPYVKRIFRKI